MTPFPIPVILSRDIEICSRVSANYVPDDKTLFMLGGRAPDPDWTRDLISRNSPAVWAADSGVRACRASGIVPSVLLGDMDSASPDDWEWAVSGGAEEKLYDRDKDRTDFQLALSLFGEAAKLDASQSVLIVSGCFGGALDHLMSIFFTLASCEGDFVRCMIDESEGVFFLSSGDEATLEFSRVPEAVSLLSVTDSCTGVSVSGVKWPLNGVTLERRYPWTVSNEVIPGATGVPQVTARCEDGTLALYWRY